MLLNSAKDTRGESGHAVDEEGVLSGTTRCIKDLGIFLPYAFMDVLRSNKAV